MYNPGRPRGGTNDYMEVISRMTKSELAKKRLELAERRISLQEEAAREAKAARENREAMRAAKLELEKAKFEAKAKARAEAEALKACPEARARAVEDKLKRKLEAKALEEQYLKSLVSMAPVAVAVERDTYRVHVAYGGEAVQSLEASGLEIVGKGALSENGQECYLYVSPWAEPHRVYEVRPASKEFLAGKLLNTSHIPFDKLIPVSPFFNAWEPGIHVHTMPWYRPCEEEQFFWDMKAVNVEDCAIITLYAREGFATPRGCYDKPEEGDPEWIYTGAHAKYAGQGGTYNHSVGATWEQNSGVDMFTDQKPPGLKKWRPILEELYGLSREDDPKFTKFYNEYRQMTLFIVSKSVTEAKGEVSNHAKWPPFLRFRMVGWLAMTHEEAKTAGWVFPPGCGVGDPMVIGPEDADWIDKSRLGYLKTLHAEGLFQKPVKIHRTLKDAHPIAFAPDTRFDTRWSWAAPDTLKCLVARPW
jgi:hypothetical protein